MTDSVEVVLGFDPGGNDKFGWSICTEDDRGILQPPLKTGLADNAPDAISKVKRALKSPDFPANPKVLAAGIEAPLFWNRWGCRGIDNLLDCAMRHTGFRRQRKDGSGLGGRIVQTVNQLQGACVIQGPLLAKYLREEEQWKDLPITESHPKVLNHLLYKTGQPKAVTEMVENAIRGLASHKLDATWCAVAAWAMLHHQEQNLPNWYDLYEWEQRESGRIVQIEGDVRYWMPIPEDLYAAG